MIPLTVLQGHLTTLRERAAAGSAEATVASSAMNEAHYLASLVHNLGAVARLDGAEAALQPGRVDLEALVARVVSRHAPVAAERGITIESATPPDPAWTRADVTLLEQAVSNVTYNAVRYNRPGGHVAVILEAEGGRFSLRVLDDGPGIPEAELSMIVQRGHRGNEARQRAPEGQGLGLHIAFRAAELHGFRLTLGPSEYGGVEARLEGPLA
jgi:signal transduction histidine kinase